MEINQYALTATDIQDQDFYDVDYWNGTTWVTHKISGATLKEKLGTVSKREVVEFINKTGAPLTKGTIVYLKTSSSSSNYPEALKADATSEATSTKTIGAVYEDTANDAVGLIVTSGEVANLDTNAYNVGDRLWLSTTPGQVTTVMPIAPNHAVFIGTVTRKQNTNGRVLYHIQNGYELEELHNVSITGTPNNGDVLIYDLATSLWKARKVAESELTFTDVTTNDVSTSKHGFAPKAPNDGTKFLDGLGAYDTVKDSDLSLSDITTNDVSTTKHGFVPKAPNDTAKFLRGDGTWATTPAGGLTNFTEAANSSAPNATVPVNSLTATGAATNIDVAIVPKGTGAVTLQIADNTTAGGNKRGANSIDLQTSRSINTSVASGSGSVVIGVDNRASAANSVAIGSGARADGIGSVAIGSGANAAGAGENYVLGNGSVASGNFGAVSLGRSNTSSGDGTLTAGFSNTASGQRAIALGEANIASANGAVALGVGVGASGIGSFASGWFSNTFGIRARKSHGNNNTVSGDCQKSEFFLSKRTTDATATTLTVAGGVASTANQVILSNNSAYRFKGTIIGKKSGTTDVAAWDIDGLIVRGANAAATTLVVSNVNVVDNTPTWGTPALTADTTNGGLKVEVTGAAATNIQWTAVIETTEVIYA